jgi:hypothetical protein
MGVQTAKGDGNRQHYDDDERKSPPPPRKAILGHWLAAIVHRLIAVQNTGP